MLILEDLHTHTTYCDGKHTPEEMVLAAIEKGLKTIGFSGHIFMPHIAEYCIGRDKVPEYKAEINALKEKYRDKIRILCGIEADVHSDEDISGYDYVIGSVHDLKVHDGFVGVDFSAEVWEQGVKKYFNGDYYLAIEQYFALVAEYIKKIKPDIIGHFDLVTKFNEGGRFFDERNERYVAAYKKALDEIIPLNIPFEINTGAISRGYRSSPYPSADILKYIAEKGGRVIFTGDTHAKENLCYKHEEFEHIAYDAGFKSICTAADIVPEK